MEIHIVCVESNSAHGLCFKDVWALQACPLTGLGIFHFLSQARRRHLHFRERENVYHRYYTVGQEDRRADKQTSMLWCILKLTPSPQHGS